MAQSPRHLPPCTQTSISSKPYRLNPSRFPFDKGNNPISRPSPPSIVQLKSKNPLPSPHRYEFRFGQIFLPPVLQYNGNFPMTSNGENPAGLHPQKEAANLLIVFPNPLISQTANLGASHVHPNPNRASRVAPALSSC
jgi:hypothetical protein